MDGAELEFEEDALSEIASLAIERNTGARGLRSILEEVMTDIMYELPSKKNVSKVIITKQCVLGNEKPKMVKKRAGIKEPPQTA